MVLPMLRKMKDTKAPLSAPDLDAVEQRLGIELPDAYRSWLLRYNGGRPIPGGFRYKHEKGPYTDGWVAWFYAIHGGESNNFVLEYERMKVDHRRLPEHLVAIAREGSGNLVCLSFGGPDEGKVYMWDHEEEGPEPTYDNCHLVADSFQEFIDGLHD